MPWPITDENVGLKILRSPTVPAHKKTPDDVIDIVAVHGMGAHPDDTWCKAVVDSGKDKAVGDNGKDKAVGDNGKDKAVGDNGKDKAVGDNGKDKKYINWLEEPNMLPAVVPNARIMRYGYDSQWFGKDTVRTKASTISQRLLLALKRERKGCFERPLIFIAHSFGGLVVLRTLVDAKQEEGKWPGIYNSTVGLVFFGTPFRGTHDALSHGEILQLAEERFGSEHVSGENLRILRSGDESLQDLVDMYLRIARQNAMPRVACFFEQKVTDVGAVLRSDSEKVVFLVDENSGCLDLNASSEKYSLPRTHFDMNKFGGPGEEDFRTLGDVLEDMAQQGPNLIASRTQQPRKHQVPFSLDGVPAIERFIGRQADIERIQDFFRPGEKVQSRRRVFVLCGMGGIGKTQLAVEFLRKHKDDYTATFWLDGSSEEQLKQSIMEAVHRIPQEELNADTIAAVNGSASAPEKELVVRGVLQWLSLPTNTRWMLVLDNVDHDYLSQTKDPSAFDVKKFFPGVDRGSILITSRLRCVLEDFGAGFLVEKLNSDDSRGVLEGGKSNSILDSNALLQRLDGLPLALAQAGAYIRMSGMSATDYLEHYDKTWADLMDAHEFGSSRYKNRSILTTWKISYDQVNIKSEGAAGLLKLWGMLDPSDLWFGLVEAVTRVHKEIEIPSWLQSLAKKKLSYDRAVGLLTQYCLVRKIEGSNGHSMHPVLHQWCSTLTDASETTCLRWISASIVAEAVPADNHRDAWKTQKRIYPHGNWIYRWISETRGSEGDAEATIFLEMGLLFSYHAELQRTKEMYLRALAGYEKALGPDHTSTLDTVNNLGALYADQGKLDKAEEMYQRAFVGKEKALGPDHTSTLNTVNNLGILYKNQGKLDKAEEMYQRALAGKEKALGPDHTSTLDTVGNLGNLYADQGKLDKAEEMYQRLPDHFARPDAIASLQHQKVVDENVKKGKIVAAADNRLPIHSSNKQPKRESSPLAKKRRLL